MVRLREWWMLLERKELKSSCLCSGGNPVPPPQVQLEEVNSQARIKKDAESGSRRSSTTSMSVARSQIVISP